MTSLDDISAQLRDYHGDVKRRLDSHDEEIKRLRVAIDGVPGDDTVPGLNAEVQGLRAFRERVRLGVGAAWALLLTMLTVLWNRK